MYTLVGHIVSYILPLPLSFLALILGEMAVVFVFTGTAATKLIIMIIQACHMYSNHALNHWDVPKCAQQNYLAKTDLDSSIFFCENPISTFVRVVVILHGNTMTSMD